MNTEELIDRWKAEEQIAHIHGWDFSHIRDRYTEEEDLPWDYRNTIRRYLYPEMRLLDIDTGGGEFLLSLNHPYENTAATEGYPPNVELCRKMLLPLGIDFRPGNPDMRKQEREQILDLGTDLTRSGSSNIYTLTIIGQIEGHQVAPETVKTTKYEHILPLLAGIEESEEIDGLLLLLNTVGGDIEAGLAIAEMIAGMKKPTVSLVLGGGHSIGIPLAVCTKRSFITPTASMTVHPVRMTGLVVGAPQTFRYFQRIQEQITDFVTANSKITRKAFEDYMMATGEMATDVGTILYGKEAVASGLIDRLGGLNDALTALHKMIEKPKNRHTPEEKEKKGR